MERGATATHTSPFNATKTVACPRPHCPPMNTASTHGATNDSMTRLQGSGASVWLNSSSIFTMANPLASNTVQMQTRRSRENLAQKIR